MTATTTKTKKDEVACMMVVMNEEELDRQHEYDDEFYQEEHQPSEQYPVDEEGKDKSVMGFVVRWNKAVKSVRCVVLAVLLFFMVGVAIMLFFYLRNQEEEDFEEQFNEDADKVIRSIGESIDTTLAALDTLAASCVSYARETNQTWPFVIIPGFTIRALKIARLAKALNVALYLDIPDANVRFQFEAYAANNTAVWVNETIDFQNRDPFYQQYNLTKEDMVLWNVIYGLDEYSKPVEEQGQVGYEPEAQGPFLPYWQFAPILRQNPAINWDFLSLTDNLSAKAARESHKVVLSEAFLIAYPNDTAKIEEINEVVNFYAPYLRTDEDPLAPVIEIFYPVLEDADLFLNVHDEPYNPADHKLVALMTASIYWRDWLKGLLPDGSNGIRVVVDNPCNPSFTYQINGEEIEYLGVGDLHQSKYSSMMKSASLIDLKRSSFYSGAPLNPERCPYALRVYPSSVFEEDFDSPDTIYIPIIAILVFIITSAVFLVYDWLVDRRQIITEAKATKTGAIVNSLFPSVVHDRLVGVDDKKDNPRRRIWKNTNKNEQGDDHTSHTNTADATTLYPIADTYPEATVGIFDLVGFTSWSSRRNPQDVFYLLETIYGAFDRIAKTRGVFKVETVGDSYVSACGVPTPSKLHAVVMCRFAEECRMEMARKCTELEATLGPGTKDLKLRLGLHSGTVTAGVLRGEKARFQLFGDTINMAARMESNSFPDKIHISSETAELIRSAAKEHWLVKREELVDIKGKGQLQTFFVQPTGQREGSESTEEDF